MTDTTLDIYYDRMRQSTYDKLRLVNFVRGKYVLDVGCGDGELTRNLADLGYTVWGVDPSNESLSRAVETQIDEGDSYKAMYRSAYADELHQQFEAGSIDTVVFCSSLHEVFSYGNRSGEIGSLRSIDNALKSARTVLKSGGRLIVRDGVHPSRGRGSIRVDDDAAVERFLDESPFNMLNGRGRRDVTIWLDKDRANNVWFGSQSSLMEFAFTYTWGPESWDREIQEFYGIYSLTDYRDVVESHGFNCISMQSYIQQDYPKFLDGKVKFLGMPFPHTNAVWVYEKR